MTSTTTPPSVSSSTEDLTPLYSPLPKDKIDEFRETVKVNEDALMLVIYKKIKGVDVRQEIVICKDRDELEQNLGERDTRNYGILDRYDLSEHHLIYFTRTLKMETPIVSEKCPRPVKA